MNKLIQRSLLNVSGTIGYVAVVATIMQNGERIFGGMNEILGPIAFLMLFVLSAAITGGLIIGKPVLMYLNNEKKDAVKLFLYTLSSLALATLIMLLLNIIF